MLHRFIIHSAPANYKNKKSAMEAILKCLDEVDDFVLVTVSRLRFNPGISRSAAVVTTLLFLAPT